MTIHDKRTRMSVTSRLTRIRSAAVRTALRNHRLLRRAISVATVMAFAAGTTLAIWSPAHATTPVYVRINAGPSPQINMAIHVPSTANGAQPVLQPFNYGTSGQWEVLQVGNGTSGELRFKNRYSQQCLAARYLAPMPPGTATPGAIIQTICNSSDQRQWWARVQDPVLPIWRILNRGSNLALAAPNAGTGVIETGTDLSDTQQMWQMW
jgi:hypothetical protein